MERFSFRLENILRLKEKLEENRERNFSKRRAELLRIEQEMTETRGKLIAFMRENSYMEGLFTAADIVSIDNYIARFQNRLEGLSEQRSDKKREVAHCMVEDHHISERQACKILCLPRSTYRYRHKLKCINSA